MIGPSTRARVPITHALGAGARANGWNIIRFGTIGAAGTIDSQSTVPRTKHQHAAHQFSTHSRLARRVPDP